MICVVSADAADARSVSDSYKFLLTQAPFKPQISSVLVTDE